MSQHLNQPSFCFFPFLLRHKPRSQTAMETDLWFCCLSGAAQEMWTLGKVHWSRRGLQGGGGAHWGHGPFCWTSYRLPSPGLPSCQLGRPGRILRHPAVPFPPTGRTVLLLPGFVFSPLGASETTHSDLVFKSPRIFKRFTYNVNTMYYVKIFIRMLPVGKVVQVWGWVGMGGI